MDQKNWPTLENVDEIKDQNDETMEIKLYEQPMVLQ
jgi:hypothetical protein